MYKRQVKWSPEIIWSVTVKVKPRTLKSKDTSRCRYKEVGGQTCIKYSGVLINNKPTKKEKLKPEYFYGAKSVKAIPTFAN